MSAFFNKTRRSFLRQVAGLSAAGFGGMSAWGAEPQSCAGPKPPATAIKWKPDTNPILPRLAASTLSPADVTKLRNAYKALRDLTVSQPDDPRGWLQQGDKHCWNCGGGLDQQAGEEIHGSWLFLPWHRAFLYFHERILGTLIKDPSLRLAYLDWDNPTHRAIPDAWVTPNNSSNSLFDANRSAVSGSQAPNSIVGPQIMNPITGAPTFAQFGGTNGSAGNLENGPHGAVHVWCGDTTMQAANADMGLLDTAAQDPLFWAHHANIDRLWSVWLSSSSTHKNPTSSGWLKHQFTFWDEQKRWVSITVADVINMSNNLRYTYGTGLSPHITGLANPVITQLMVDSNRAITLPASVKSHITPAAVGAQPKLTRLRLAGVALPSGASGIYRIVANKPAGIAAPEVAGTPNDLGYIAIVPKNSKGQVHQHGGSLTIDLDVTTQLPQLIEENGKLTLSAAPMAANSKSTQLDFQSVYLVEG